MYENPLTGEPSWTSATYQSTRAFEIRGKVAPPLPAKTRTQSCQCKSSWADCMRASHWRWPLSRCLSARDASVCALLRLLRLGGTAATQCTAADNGQWTSRTWGGDGQKLRALTSLCTKHSVLYILCHCYILRHSVSRTMCSCVMPSFVPITMYRCVV